MQKRTLTVSLTTHRDCYVPFIRLSGAWLAEAGFHCGDKISVQVRKPGQLLIEKIEGKEDRREYQ